jgi:hypothetical protein
MHMEGQMAKQIGMEQLLDWLYRNCYMVAKYRRHGTEVKLEPIPQEEIEKLIPKLIAELE